MLGGLPFGIGFVLIFVALSNYIVDSYKIYSASAMGATSIARSTFGVLLPLAARPMYDRLGIGWACSLLGFLSLGMCAIPYLFIAFGERMREASPICRELAREGLEKKRRESGGEGLKGGDEGEGVEAPAANLEEIEQRVEDEEQSDEGTDEKSK